MTNGAVSARARLLGTSLAMSVAAENYVIRSLFGDFRVPVALVNCAGDDCPVFEELGQDIRFAAASEKFGMLLQPILTSFSGTAELTAGLAQADTGERAIDLNNARGELVARYTMLNAGPAEAAASLAADAAQLAVISQSANDPAIAGTSRTILAQDALNVIASSDVPFTSLSTEDLEAIFSLQVTNWSELGGPNLPITAVRPADSTGGADVFARVILDPAFSEFGDGVAQYEDGAALANAVATTPGAIGLATNRETGGNKVLGIESSCGIVSRPSTFGIKSEDYPLTRRIYLYVHEETPSNGVEVADFFASDAGIPTLERAGLTTLAPSRITLDTQGSRLAYALSDRSQAVEVPNLVNFAQSTAGAERLSLTYRFATGSASLDDKGVSDIARLLEFLASPEGQGREVLLIGFADSIGQSELNRVLSERRADGVRDQIVAASGGAVDASRFNVLGFGSSAPVACNDTEFERSLNRRVEVWVR